uniref:Secreted protein n=1 Tax=Mesocestoides corti TaxID=53468 RepID=A0A5K3EHN0_MESCO
MNFMLYKLICCRVEDTSTASTNKLSCPLSAFLLCFRSGRVSVDRRPWCGFLTASGLQQGQPGAAFSVILPTNDNSTSAQLRTHVELIIFACCFMKHLICQQGYIHFTCPLNSRHLLFLGDSLKA